MRSATDLAYEVISHHLRLFGVDDSGVDSRNATPARLLLLTKPDIDDVQRAQSFIAGGGVAIAALANADFCHAFGVTQKATLIPAPVVLAYQPEPKQVWARLRTLHPYHAFHHPKGLPVVIDPTGDAVWLRLQSGSSGLLLIGTDLAADLVRYRQGDPTKAAARPTEAYWGIAGERPNYLFEEQLKDEPPQERHADWWATALARFMSGKLDKKLLPLLPGDAPGAVIITGDDDQAYLEKYAEQQQFLKSIPITYFLHPLTRHTPDTLHTMLDKPWIDLGIHPDALDTPARYGELLREQVAWFKRLTGQPPLSLRNHGYLNDGYWGHLPHWIEANIRISSNMTGLDGRVLNGSLLPARLAYNGTLTDHWSLLTAIGDGVRFISKMSEAQSAECVFALADRIRQSGVPGIMVLNLHPQNVGETKAMHRAAMEVIKSGFYPWTMADCLDWFERRDAGVRAATRFRIDVSPLRRMWNHVRSKFLSRAT